MKTAAILWLSLGLVLQVDILQAGPVNVASEDLGLGTEEEVNELELSGSGMDVEQIDEEYINSSKRSNSVLLFALLILHKLLQSYQRRYETD